MDPREAKLLWSAYKKKLLADARQKKFLNNTRHLIPERNFWNQYGRIGRENRMAYYNLVRRMENKYGYVYNKTLKPHKLAENLAPMYGYGGLINRVRRARERIKLTRVSAIKPGLNRWRHRAQVRIAEKMMHDSIAEKHRNIEKKIAHIRVLLKNKNANRNVVTNAIRNAKSTINSTMMLNNNTKKKYNQTLNELVLLVPAVQKKTVQPSSSPKRGPPPPPPNWQPLIIPPNVSSSFPPMPPNWRNKIYVRI